MKSNGKLYLVLAAAGITAAAVITTTLLRADDKAASPNTTAKSGADSKSSDLFPDPVVARGKGVEIKRSALDEAMARIRASADAYGQRIPTADLERISFDRLLQM
ncbi:MAG TPA: hypothetical protein VFB72_15130, partial [Verrucomicrobiae bacterium]|nr:hypothetical protein [Verrucomicrobiae bacterium]